MNRENFKKAERLNGKIERLKSEKTRIERPTSTFRVSHGEGTVIKEILEISHSELRQILSDEYQRRIDKLEKEFDEL